MQAWVFAVPHLRADAERRRWLWSGHEELVDAMTLGDLTAARAVIEAHHDRALAWLDHLGHPDTSPRAQAPAGPPPPRPDHGERRER